MRERRRFWGSIPAVSRPDQAGWAKLVVCLAVEMGHLRRVIPGARDALRCYRCVDARDIGGIKFEIEGAERFLELVAAPGAKHRQDIGAA